MKIFNHIFSFVLAIVVLFSTTTITINKHYCGKSLVKTTVITHNDGCKKHERLKSKSCCEVFKKDCCDDEQLVFEGLDHLKFEKYIPDYNLSYDFYSEVLHAYNIDLNAYVKLIEPSYFNYRPPPLVKPIYSLVEVYLI
jgi:hypothetical protein